MSCEESLDDMIDRVVSITNIVLAMVVMMCIIIWVTSKACRCYYSYKKTAHGKKSKFCVGTADGYQPVLSSSESDPPSPLSPSDEDLDAEAGEEIV